MKKLSIILILLIITGITVYLVSPPKNPDKLSTADLKINDSQAINPEKNPSSDNSTNNDPNNSSSSSNADEATDSAEESDRPANEIYSSAEEALKAVKDGAAKYDDAILEQFTLMSDDCSWCDSFYSSIKDLISSSSVSNDEKSYYSEILAISGKVDNVKTLINAIEGSPSKDVSEVYTEALEMTVGKDDVVKYLATKLTTPNSDLKESVVAAITNQGSPLAIDTLFKNIRESNNPDGFYSQGTGPGEVIPDEESYPLLKDYVQKRDDYSHLAVKSLLNAGLDGVKIVFETLQDSGDPEKDKTLLKDALDHVNYGEDIEAYLKDKGLQSKNPVLSKFAKDALASFANSDTETGNLDDKLNDNAG